ncbi:unnamed protein product [Absidia cylindrospora]
MTSFASSLSHPDWRIWILAAPATNTEPIVLDEVIEGGSDDNRDIIYLNSNSNMKRRRFEQAIQIWWSNWSCWGRPWCLLRRGVHERTCMPSMAPGKMRQQQQQQQQPKVLPCSYS